MREACEAYAADPSPMNKARMFMAAETLEAMDNNPNACPSIEYNMNT